MILPSDIQYVFRGHKIRISREYKGLFVSVIAAQKSRGELVSDTIPHFSYTREGHVMSY